MGESFVVAPEQGRQANTAAEMPGTQKFIEYISAPTYMSPLTIKEAYDKHVGKADADKNGFLTKDEISNYKKTVCTSGSCTKSEERELKALSVLEKSTDTLQSMYRDEYFWKSENGVSARDMHLFAQQVKTRNEQLTEAFKVQDYILKNRGQVVLPSNDVVSLGGINQERRWQTDAAKQQIADLAIKHLDDLRYADGTGGAATMADALFYPHYVANKFGTVTAVERALNNQEDPASDPYPVLRRPLPSPSPLEYRLYSGEIKTQTDVNRIEQSPLPPDIPTLSVADQLNVSSATNNMIKTQTPFLEMAKQHPETFISASRSGYTISRPLQTDTKEVADAKTLVSSVVSGYPNEGPIFALTDKGHFLKQIDNYESFLKNGSRRYEEALRLFDASQKLGWLDKDKNGVTTKQEFTEASTADKAHFSPKELEVLSKKFDQLKAAQKIGGSTVEGLNKDVIESFVATELLDTGNRKMAGMVSQSLSNYSQFNQSRENWGFSNYLNYFQSEWDINNNSLLERNEMDEAIKTSKGIELQIANITLKNFDTLEAASGDASLAQLVHLAPRGITRDAPWVMEAMAHKWYRDYSNVSNTGYQSFMLDLLRNRLMP